MVRSIYKKWRQQRPTFSNQNQAVCRLDHTVRDVKFTTRKSKVDHEKRRTNNVCDCHSSTKTFICINITNYCNCFSTYSELTAFLFCFSIPLSSFRLYDQDEFGSAYDDIINQNPNIVIQSKLRQNRKNSFVYRKMQITYCKAVLPYFSSCESKFSKVTSFNTTSKLLTSKLINYFKLNAQRRLNESDNRCDYDSAFLMVCTLQFPKCSEGKHFIK